MFKIHIKQYIKNPVLITFTLLLFPACIFFLYLNLWDANPFFKVDALYASMKLMEYLFLAFLFLSYEFFTKIQNAKLNEVVGGSALGRLGAERSKFMVMLLLNLMVTALFFCFNMWRGMFFHVWTGEYMRHIISILFLYHFLVYLLAILIAWVVSCIPYKLLGYAALLYVNFTFGSFVGRLQGGIPESYYAYRVTDLFSLYSKQFQIVPNYYYLISTEAVNYQRIGFWILLTLSLLLLLKIKGRGKTASTLPFVGALVCLFLFFQPSAAYYKDLGYGYDSWTADDTYYRINGRVEDSLHERANFRAIHYNMEFDVNRILKATVKVGVDQPDLKEYHFTLYHGYKVKDVSNQLGEGLPFSREGDYISVYGTGVAIETLEFTYEGYNNAFYTTKQGMYLPVYFEYFPIPGYHPVFLCLEHYQAYSLETMPYPVEFDVKVNAGQKVYSNLEQMGKNRFHGYADGVTLLGGPFIREGVIGTNRIVYSYLDGVPEIREREYRDLFDEYADGENAIGGKTIIVPPYNCYVNYGFASDHLIGDFYELKDAYRRYVDNRVYDLAVEEAESEIFEESDGSLKDTMEGVETVD